MAVVVSGLDKDRHHEIFKKVVGTVIMLPSESAGVIVNHEDAAGIRVSCIIKKTVRKAIAQWYGNRDGTRWIPPSQEFELETPTLMYSTTYGVAGQQPSLALTDAVRKMKTGDQMALVELNETSEDRIMVKPYRIGNVYDAGNICWGGNETPADLRGAHNLFWSSGINTDFGGPVHDFKGCTKVNHSYRSHETPNMMHRHEHIGLCANGDDCKPYNQGLLAKNGPWKNGLTPHVRCEYCRSLISGQIGEELVERLGGISTLCLCCIGRCSKESGCTCNCNCCRKTCNCLCNCDLTDEWVIMMRTYQKKLDKLSWEDWTRLICGRKWNQEAAQFFSYNGKCDAVFISYDKNLIKRVGKENVRKHYSWDAVIGLASMTKTGWRIDIGGQQFELGKNKVVPLADKWESVLQRQAREDREYAELQARQRREREVQRVQRQVEEREKAEREEARAKALMTRIERGEVSERESASELWRRFYMNEKNSSWWQSSESLLCDSTVEVGRTWTT